MYGLFACLLFCGFVGICVIACLCGLCASLLVGVCAFGVHVCVFARVCFVCVCVFCLCVLREFGFKFCRFACLFV